MVSPRLELKLDLTPATRFDLIDVTDRVRKEYGEVLSRYRKALYHSYHTTAGYFEQSLCERLDHDRDTISKVLRYFQTLFPPNADYRHDRLELRNELSDEEKLVEPRNADSHLTFIGSGLMNCVTYDNQPPGPVYFVDLDGVYETTTRCRRTTVIGFNEEETVREMWREIPVSGHPIDSVNLRDSRFGLFEELEELIEHYQIVKGRVDISLGAGEFQTGLTVNEYETLLMKHDLVDVLSNPLRFMAETGRRMIREPKAIPGKALNYAKYDLVQIVNEVVDALGLSESFVERILDKFLAVPASRFLWMKRSLSLLISDQDYPHAEREGSIVHGKYQSPILVQWKRPANDATRRVGIRIVRFV